MGAGAPEPVQLASRRATRMMSLSVLSESSSSGVTVGRDADQEPAGRRGLVILQHIPHETVGVSALKIALQCVWDFTAVRL